MIGSAGTLPRDARLLLLSLFLNSLPIGLLMVFFPLYLHDLGLRPFLIGGVFTLAGIGSSLLLMVIGPLADRFGRRPFLLAGTALPVLGFIIFALTTSTGALVVASLLGGVGFSGGLGGGLVEATFNPTLVSTVGPQRRTALMSWAEVAWGLAIGIGALLAGVPAWLVHAHVATPLAAARAIFVFCLLVTVVATLLLLPVRETAEPLSRTTPADHPAPARAGGTASLILRLAVFFALQGAGLGLVVQLLPLWFALRFHAGATTIAPWFSAAQVAGLPLIPLVPLLARRLGVAGVIALVAGVSTLLLAGVPFAPALPLAGLLFVGRSAIVSMQWPAQLSFLQGAVAPRIRGTATSVTMGCWSMTGALLPVLTGYLLDRRLLLWPFALGFACYAAAVAWFWLTLRRTPLPEEAAAEPYSATEVSVAR